MIRIALADDHKMFAKGIQGLLEEEEEFKIVGLFHNGKDLVEFVKQNSVDIILTDMNMPKMDGLGVINTIRSFAPHARIIVLSMYDDQTIYDKAVKNGANAYVLKGSDPDELIYTIKEVFQGTYVLDYKRVIFQSEPDGYPDYFKEKFKLSRRELEIIKMIKDGKMNKEIAEILSLSQHTVEAHRKKIHLKLGVNTAVELVKIALEMKI